jgi:hypothetical protein
VRTQFDADIAIGALARRFCLEPVPAMPERELVDAT